MKKILVTFLIFFPCISFAESIEDNGFILYKKPLLPGFSFNQTDTTTELIYRGKIIKTYKNEEFAIELLPHGPKEEPDCYNSLSKNILSDRMKTLIGKDYLRDCFILKSDKIQNDYLLLYSPSIEGNRASLYDLKTKKYYHWILNTVLSYRRYTKGAVIFLTKNSHNLCNRTLYMFYNGKLTKLIDNCFLSVNGVGVKISSFKVDGGSLEINYFDVNLKGNDYVTSTEEKKYRYVLTLDTLKPTEGMHSGSSLLLHTIKIQK